jgi:hypothetical protein
MFEANLVIHFGIVHQRIDTSKGLDSVIHRLRTTFRGQ